MSLSFAVHFNLDELAFDLMVLCCSYWFCVCFFHRNYEFEVWIMP